MRKKLNNKKKQTWRDYTIRLNNNKIISMASKYDCKQEHVLTTWYEVWCRDDDNQMSNKEIWDITEAILEEELKENK